MLRSEDQKLSAKERGNAKIFILFFIVVKICYDQCSSKPVLLSDDSLRLESVLHVFCLVLFSDYYLSSS